jgi:hypothetical protein
MNIYNAPRTLETSEITGVYPAQQPKFVPEVADLSDRLHKLSEAALLLSTRLASEELTHRCSVLASGAKIAAALLMRMPQSIVGTNEIGHEPASLRSQPADGIETKRLYELGWSAMELGLKTEALAVLQMVGTLLHGKLGGSVFKIESLLAIGKLDEAATLYQSEIANAPDDTALADAIFAFSWSRRGDASWRSVKMRAGQHN